LLEALQISIGTKEKCAELEEAWNSCADTAELLKEEVAEAVHGYPPVSTNVLSLKSPIWFDDFPLFSYENHSEAPLPMCNPWCWNMNPNIYPINHPVL